MGFKVFIFCLFAFAPCFSFSWDDFFYEGKRQDSPKTVDAECVRKAREGNCQFFACFDDRHSCPSASNFALKYGLKYCSRFEAHKHQMTKEGQSWLNVSRICLMERMIDYYTDDSIDCHSAKSELKDKMADCEAEAGLCSSMLLIGNRDIFTDVYGFNRQSITFFVSTVTRHCGPELLREVGRWFGQAAKHVRDYIRSEDFSPILAAISQYADLAKVSLTDQLARLQRNIGLGFLTDDQDGDEV